ncbi:hypothetical protein COOONC_14439 [Cooperia oncophora]
MYPYFLGRIRFWYGGYFVSAKPTHSVHLGSAPSELSDTSSTARSWRLDFFPSKSAFGCDSQCAVSILKKASLKPNLRSLARQVWDLCEILRAQMEFGWIPRSLNVEADTEFCRSRRLEDIGRHFHRARKTWTCSPAQHQRNVKSSFPDWQVIKHAASTPSRQRPPPGGATTYWWVPHPHLIPSTLPWAKLHLSRGILGFPVWPSHLSFPLLVNEGWIPEILEVIVFPAGTKVLQDLPLGDRHVAAESTAMSANHGPAAVAEIIQASKGHSISPGTP